MNKGKFVYAQIVEFLPQRVFDTIVLKYDGNRYVKHFTCWNQLLVMVFGQLTNRDSLRDLIVAIEAHSRKSYHLGFGKSVTRSNLSKANENRDYRIFEEFAYYLIGVARQKLENNDFEIKGKVYAFDSTTVDLCLSVFWRAKFRKNKGGVKIHTLLDITTQIPVFVHITTASVNDMNAMDVIPYEVGAYYIFDRGYVDYTRLYRITKLESSFVVRAKKNLKFEVKSHNPVDETTGVMTDQTGFLKGFYTSKDYPESLRRVAFYDRDKNTTLIFLTNNFELTADQVAMLYKNRWQIELFFYDKYIIMQSRKGSMTYNQSVTLLLLISTSHKNSQRLNPLSHSSKFLFRSHSRSVSILGTRFLYAFSSASRLALESARA